MRVTEHYTRDAKRYYVMAHFDWIKSILKSPNHWREENGLKSEYGLKTSVSDGNSPREKYGPMSVGLFTEKSEPIHSTASLLVFLFGSLSAIYSFRVMKLPFSLISLFLGVMSLFALVLFASQQYLGLGVGGMERMIVYPILMWTIGFSGYLFASPEKS
jgi:hypothetical protein